MQRKKLTVDFDGGNQSSDAGLLVLRAAEQRIGIVRRMALALRDRRDPTRVEHQLTEIIGARVFGLACGWEDGIDQNLLRDDPAMKIAVGRAPGTGAALASQSTVSRFENAPSKTDAARLAAALVDHFAECVQPAPRNILDIDDTFSAAHGGQQLAFWNAHHDERGFATMHVFDAGSGLPVASILRPAKTPGGREVRTVVKHVTQRLRKTWKKASIVWRGDSHYARVEAMDWCDANGAGYVFGLAGNAALDAHVAEISDHLRFWHALSDAPKSRCYKAFWYRAGSWSGPRRVIARIEASLQPAPMPEQPDVMRQEIDVRYVVTTLEGDPERIYEGVYCQRGQAENLIKLHKCQLASRRTSCHRAVANQIRLMLSTAAFWLLNAVRRAIPEGHALARAEFNTIRLRLLKIAVRVEEFGARIRAHLPTSCVEKALFRHVRAGAHTVRMRRGARARAAAERGRPTPNALHREFTHERLAPAGCPHARVPIKPPPAVPDA